MLIMGIGGHVSVVLKNRFLNLKKKNIQTS